MANTYYDSQLTAEEIEEVLEAISGILNPANNGKVLAISDGKLEARSVQWGGGGGNYQSKTVTPSANEQTVSPDSGYDALSSVVVNGDVDLVAGNIKKDVEIFGVTGSYEGSGSDPVIYGNSNPIFDFSIAGGLICTVEGRSYYKTTGDPCICAYAYRKGVTANYTGPILVAKSADAAKNSQDSQPISFTYKGETWYRGGGENAMHGDLTSTGGFAVKLNDLVEFQTLPTHEEAAIALLDYYYSHGNMTVPNNGNYPIPQGYDGFGPLIVSVAPSLQSKTVIQNGTVTPDSGYDGLSRVIVNVSSSDSLPSEYQEVEYLITGSSCTYVSIPSVVIYQNDVISFKTVASNWLAQNFMAFLGIKASINDGSSYRIEIYARYGYPAIYANGGGAAVHDATDPTKRASGASYVYSELLDANDAFDKSIVIETANSSKNIYYGAYSTTEYFPNSKLYPLQYNRENGNSVLKLIPCYRKADSVCGFYDLRSNTFFTATTGSFTAGPDVN